MHKQNDAFDHWLSLQLSEGEGYLDDNGFTANVLAKLPTQPLMQSTSSRPRLPVIIATIISTILVLWLFPVAFVVETVLFANISILTLLGIGVAASIIASAAAIFANQHV